MFRDSNPNDEHSLAALIGCVVGGLVTRSPEGARIGKHLGKLIGTFLS